MSTRGRVNGRWETRLPLWSGLNGFTLAARPTDANQLCQRSWMLSCSKAPRSGAFSRPPTVPLSWPTWGTTTHCPVSIPANRSGCPRLPTPRASYLPARRPLRWNSPSPVPPSSQPGRCKRSPNPQGAPMSRTDDRDSDAEIQRILRRALSRRQFLGRTAAAAGGLAFGSSFLAACKGKEQAAGGAAAGGESGTKVVRVSNWPLYIDAKTVPDFEAATGIKVEYTEDINDNNEYFAKIDEPIKRGQSIDREIIVLTDWMAGRLITLGYVAPLDDSKFPNKANLVDNLRDVSFDPGRKYSVPWLSGMTGVGYNPKKTGRELTSMNDIFDPKFK